MAQKTQASVVEVLKKSRDGLSYEELRDKMQFPDENEFKQVVLLEMRKGTVDIRNGRIIASVPTVHA